jgi:hypothetical protein
MSYHTEAREYIDRLVRIQRFLVNKYPNRDHKAILNSLTIIRIGYDTIDTRKDSGMMKFWKRFREAIEYLIPGKDYSGYEKLRKEFEALDQVEVWQMVSHSLI